MSLSNLYFKNCFSELTEEQKAAIDSISVEDEVVDKSCARDVNTCGTTVEELFDEYALYDPQRGLYRSWGDIIFPWDIDVSVRSNLNYSLTDDKWKIAKYAALYAYFDGDRVLYIEDDGYKVCLYEANQDIVAIAGPLDKTKWDQVCCIELSEPFGLPTLEELEERCHYYDLEFFWKKWKNYSGEWEDNFFEQAISTCNTAGVSTAEFIERLKERESEYECASDKSSDRWLEARVRKENFYERGDCVLVKGVCEDTVCVYLATQDIPATESNFNELKQFKSRLKPSSETTSYTVTVQSVVDGNRYFIDGSQQSTLNLREGQTYRFRQDDSSNANHPIRFSTTPNGTHGGGAEFTQGVTIVGTAGSTGAYTEITVPEGAPTLYYYCVNHSLMGGTANTLGLLLWERLYCLQTGRNKCLEPQRKRDLPNYQLVEIGSLGHYVEQPIPYYNLEGKYICEEDNIETLNERLECTEPRVLTDEEIDQLDPP